MAVIVPDFHLIGGIFGVQSDKFVFLVKNDHRGPSYINMFTLSAGLSTLRGMDTTNFPMLMAGSLLAMLPAGGRTRRRR